MNSNIVLLLVFVSVVLAEECCAGDRNDLQVWPRARGTAYPRGWSADERIPMTTGQYQKLHQKSSHPEHLRLDFYHFVGAELPFDFSTR
jgi:hypothetical protein